MSSETPFADRLIAATRAVGPLCVGLDPYPERIPALFGPPGAEAIRRFCFGVLDAAKGRVGIVKPQAALFERFGPAGYQVLADVCAKAKALGFVVILDAKRGDIGATGAGYAKAFLGPDPAIGVDCVTVSPYMGRDSIEPFVAAAEATHKGVAVLARTSNPGAADLQGLMINGRPLYERTVEMLAPFIERLDTGKTGFSSLMMVVGATAPEEARAIRALAPKALFLTPGYGAQGAGAAEALSGYATGPNGLEGGVVSASRSVLYPEGGGDAGDEDAWSEIIASAVDAAQADLQTAANA